MSIILSNFVKIRMDKNLMRQQLESLSKEEIINLITQFFNHLVREANNGITANSEIYMANEFGRVKLTQVNRFNAMLEEKCLYRVPTIDEFIHGFTYEIYSEGYFEDSVEDYCGWYKYTVGVDSWRNFGEIEHELQNGNIRVKI